MKKLGLWIYVIVSIMVEAGTLDDFEGTSSASLKLGTLGIGLEIEEGIAEDMQIRGNIHTFHYNAGKKLNQINYNSSLKSSSIGMLLDYYPQEGNLRITGGFYYINNNLDGTASISSKKSIKFGNHSYKGAIKKIDATVDFNHFAPYLGLGIGTKQSNSAWNLTFDVGFLYQGTPEISVTPIINSRVPISIQQQIISDIDSERTKIQNDVESYRFYPVVMIGASYKF